MYTTIYTVSLNRSDIIIVTFLTLEMATVQTQPVTYLTKNDPLINQFLEEEKRNV